jgi:Exonuclease V gamma subunit
MYGQNGVHYRCANLNLRDRISAWVENLARSAADSQGDFKTILIGKDEIISWVLVPTAANLLRDLCDLYWRGLHQPVPFFPESGFAYVAAEHKRAGNLSPRQKRNGTAITTATMAKNTIPLSICYFIILIP